MAGLRRWAPLALGLSVGQVAVGLVSIPALRDPTPSFRSTPTTQPAAPFDSIVDVLGTEAPPTTTIPDLSTVLADLTPAGFELLPPAPPLTGPLDAAAFASIVDADAAEAHDPTIAVPGFRGFARVWRHPDGRVVAQLVVELPRASDVDAFFAGNRVGAQQRYPDSFAPSTAAPDAFTVALAVEGATGWEGRFRKGDRVYYVDLVVPGTERPAIAELETLVAEQYGVAP